MTYKPLGQIATLAKPNGININVFLRRPANCSRRGPTPKAAARWGPTPSPTTRTAVATGTAGCII